MAGRPGELKSCWLRSKTNTVQKIALNWIATNIGENSGASVVGEWKPKIIATLVALKIF